MKIKLLIIVFIHHALLACGQEEKRDAAINQNQATMKTNQIPMENKMKIEVWSDVMCPFCYIGKRNYETALKQFADNHQVEIVWKSFQLDPTIIQDAGTKVNVYQYLADRKGMSYEQSKQMHESVTQTAKAAGLEYNFDKAIIANSFNMHRIIQMAKTKGWGDKAEERFFSAYFTEGKDCGDISVLTELGKEIGFTETDVKEALTNDEYAYKVKQDIQEAQTIGVRGVPFFVFHRKYAISGAQPPEVFLETLQKSFAEWRRENPVSELEIKHGAVCKPDGSCE